MVLKNSSRLLPSAFIRGYLRSARFLAVSRIKADERKTFNPWFLLLELDSPSFIRVDPRPSAVKVFSALVAALAALGYPGI